jgi:hypothetical protein
LSNWKPAGPPDLKEELSSYIYIARKTGFGCNSYFFIFLAVHLVEPVACIPTNVPTPAYHFSSQILEKALPKMEQAKVSEIGLCCFFTQKMVKVKKEKRLTSQDLDQFLAKLFTMLGLRPYSQLSQQIMYA